jgi:hypothetical protein
MAAVAVVFLVAACTSKSSTTANSPSTAMPATPASSSSSTVYAPKFNPADFSATVDNPWFPLTPGSSYTYKGVKDGKVLIDHFVVTNKTSTIDGVPVREISDKSTLAGRPSETTSDFYSQDSAGNVWYFGEKTAELSRSGKVKNTTGSWQTGANGAQPGIFMQANPTVGFTSRQEYLPGQAEDQYQVVSLNSSVTVPYGAYGGNAMLTKEWTALEPNVLDHKFYVKGIGEVAELSVSGPTEKARLVSASGLAG